MRELDNNEIEELTRPNTDPIIWYDKEMRCASKGCGSSTYLQLRGIPRCMMHALRECNEILKELEEELGAFLQPSLV